MQHKMLWSAAQILDQNIWYHIHLMAFLQDNLESAPER